MEGTAEHCRGRGGGLLAEHGVWMVNTAAWLCRQVGAEQEIERSWAMKAPLCLVREGGLLGQGHWGQSC